MPPMQHLYTSGLFSAQDSTLITDDFSSPMRNLCCVFPRKSCVSPGGRRSQHLLKQPASGQTELHACYCWVKQSGPLYRRGRRCWPPHLPLSSLCIPVTRTSMERSPGIHEEGKQLTSPQLHPSEISQALKTLHIR